MNIVSKRIASYPQHRRSKRFGKKVDIEIYFTMIVGRRIWACHNVSTETEEDMK